MTQEYKIPVLRGEIRSPNANRKYSDKRNNTETVVLDLAPNPYVLIYFWQFFTARYIGEKKLINQNTPGNNNEIT